jgi:hypothetical protein
MIFPFFRDFLNRYHSDRLRTLGQRFPAFGGTIARALASRKTAQEAVSYSDLIFILIGIALLILSFLVSLAISLHRL